MSKGNEAPVKRRGVLNIGVTRYACPLSATDEKKFRHLSSLAEFHVVGFSEAGGYRRAHVPAELYLLRLLPMAALRFAFLLAFSVVLGARLGASGRVTTVVSQSPYEGIAGVLLRSIARLFRRKLVVITEVHGDWEEAPFLYRRLPLTSWIRPVLEVWSAFVLRRSDRVRTISLFLEKRLHAVAPAVPLFRFPGYTDFELFSSRAETHPEGSPIVAVGGLYPVKGFGHLLRAWRRVADESREAQLVLVGEGPLRQTLDEEAAELEVSDRIRFVSKLSQEELGKLYRSARVMVVPSLSEGLGRVVWEAMASGLPVVASNVGGIPDLVVDGETGFLSTTTRTSTTLAILPASLRLELRARPTRSLPARLPASPVKRWSISSSRRSTSPVTHRCPTTLPSLRRESRRQR